MVQLDEVFVFLEPETDPDVDRVVHEHDGAQSLLVWAPNSETAARVAAEQLA